MTPAERALVRLRQVVDLQAEDAALWRIDVTTPEAYLQQALRRLHALVEDATDDSVGQS